MFHGQSQTEVEETVASQPTSSSHSWSHSWSAAVDDCLCPRLRFARLGVKKRVCHSPPRSRTSRGGGIRSQHARSSTHTQNTHTHTRTTHLQPKHSDPSLSLRQTTHHTPPNHHFLQTTHLTSLQPFAPKHLLFFFGFQFSFLKPVNICSSHRFENICACSIERMSI